ncbi:MAG: rhodanese-like domain-containing protein [Deltaproteobacteria bacterium]|nr:rhodanese-like domain-containing protein [Deltaproteobacteria bacterium]
MKKIISIFIVLLLFSPVVLHAAEKPVWKWISAKRVYDLLKEGSGLWLVDVRSEHAFNRGHMVGAMNIPGNTLKVKKLPENRIVVLVDHSIGQKLAREAAEILIGKGMKKAFVMKGGIGAWSLTGYPVWGDAGKKTAYVTARDLKWALQKGTEMNVYDMRGKEVAKEGTVSGAVVVKGTTLDERIENLQKIFKSEQKKKNLVMKLKGAGELVLVFSASDKGKEHAEMVAMSAGRHVRYLLGGYEAFAMDGKKGETKTIGSCPVCPRSGKQ